MTKYILSLLAGLLFLTSCEDNKDPLMTLQDANVYFMTDQSVFVPSVSENNAILKVPLILAGIPGTYPVTVTVRVDTKNSINPAREGEDFVIKKKEITFEEGYGQKYIEIRTIDNDRKNPVRHFDLVIEAVSRPQKENLDNRITVSILDDEHPLREFFGLYTGSGYDLFTGKLVQLTMTISADPDDDAMVLLQGFPPNPLVAIKLRLDPQNNLCSFPGAQLIDIDPTAGETRFFKCHRKEDGYLGWDYDDVPGNISENGTLFTFTEWLGAVIIEEGSEHYGGAFYAYKDFTLKKR